MGFALLALAPPMATTGFAVVGCRRPSTRMVSQVVDAVTPAAESAERHVRQLDPKMPIPKERLQGMPLSRYVRLVLRDIVHVLADCCCCLLYERS